MAARLALVRVSGLDGRQLRVHALHEGLEPAVVLRQRGDLGLQRVLPLLVHVLVALRLLGLARQLCV